MLWTGTSGAGLYQFVLGRFAQNTTEPEATGYMIKQIGEDKSGSLYFLSESGLFRFNGRNLASISGETKEILSFAINNSGIWWATRDTLFLQQTSGLILKKRIAVDLIIPDQDHAHQMLIIGPKEISVVNEMLETKERISIPVSINPKWIGYTFDADSMLWIASDEGQLMRFNGFSNAIVRSGPGEVKDIAAGALGSLWIADQQGVSIYQPQDSTLITLQMSSPVNCLYFDRSNRLWIGSATEGLIRYFGEQHREWVIPDDVEMLFSGAQTHVAMVSTKAGDIIQLGNAKEQITAPGTKDDLRQMYRDKKSRIWALTENRLWMHHDTSWILMDSSGLVNGVEIVGSDIPGNIWFAGKDILRRYGMKPVSFPTGVTFVSTQISGAIPADETISMLADNTGLTYRIGSHSVGHITLDKYLQTHHLGFKVLCGDLDSTGNIWLGTEASGIFRVAAEGSQSPKPLQTTYPLRISDIVFVKSTGNSLIAGTDRNILQLHTDTSGLHVTKIEVLNEAAGITLSGLNRNHYAITDDGHLLVMTGEKVIEFDLWHNDGVSQSPSVSISQIMINGTDIRDTRYQQLLGSFNKQLAIPEFSASENTITFVLAGNSIEDEYLFYQWRLRGFQNDWSEPSVEKEIQFSGLSPGIYELEARVCDASGNCGETAEPWRFVIRKALWHHLWFWPSIALIAITGIWLFFHQRLKRQRHDADREKRRLEAELNALTLEQKSLQLQMNPHFIFNALQSVRSQIHEDKLEDARNYLTRFAKLMRTMLEMSRSEKITLEDELEFLQAYVDVEKMSHHHPIVFSMHLDDDLDTYAIEIPPMIIQPILENAIKYGGDGKEIKVDMRITQEAKLLRISIADNGKGFGSHASVHKSAALDIIKNRLVHLGKGGGLEIGKSKEGGAVVTLRIPVEG